MKDPGWQSAGRDGGSRGGRRGPDIPQEDQQVGAMWFVLLLFVSLPESPDIARTVDALQRRFAAVQAIGGEFTQVYRAPGIEQRESGVFWLKKPGLMRWEYRQPETKLFVADGRDTFLFTPEDRQVLVRRFTSEELLSTPLRFLFGQGDIRQTFEIRSETEYRAATEGGLLAHLVPREAESEYLFLVLEIDPATFGLSRLVVRERTGNTSEFLFRNLSMNPRLDPKLFRFSIPKGVEVIRQDER